MPPHPLEACTFSACIIAKWSRFFLDLHLLRFGQPSQNILQYVINSITGVAFCKTSNNGFIITIQERL